MPKKVFTGTVIKDSMDKTITVAVSMLVQHPLYKKTTKKTSKLKAHDENNECKVGDEVTIIESRPYSKTKKWVVYKKNVDDSTDVMKAPQGAKSESAKLEGVSIDDAKATTKDETSLSGVEQGEVNDNESKEQVQ